MDGMPVEGVGGGVAGFSSTGGGGAGLLSSAVSLGRSLNGAAPRINIKSNV